MRSHNCEMLYLEQPLKGLYILEIEKLSDGRGFFARTFDESEIGMRGLTSRFPQHSVSYNAKQATLRGLHYQSAPFEEVKIVACTQGAIFDAVVDIRPTSSSYGRWLGFELSSANHRRLYIPAGFAHGFQTLCNDCIVEYKISSQYSPEHAAGIRWDDPILGIRWPEAKHRLMSERDSALPFFES